MGPPSKCPYTRDELAELSKRMSLPELVVHTKEVHGVTANKTTVFRWRKNFDIHLIKLRTPSPKPPPKKSWRIIDCPYSNERLKELYWVEGASVVEIGQMVALELGRKVVSEKAVERWLKDAGIKRRSCAEAQKVRAVKMPEQMREIMLRNRTPTPPVGKGFTKEQQIRGRKKFIANRKARAERENGPYTRVCCLPGCSTMITRAPSAYGHVWFCSVDHRNKYISGSEVVKDKCRDRAATQWNADKKKD